MVTHQLAAFGKQNSLNRHHEKNLDEESLAWFMIFNNKLAELA
jgi:hypothetical protein